MERKKANNPIKAQFYPLNQITPSDIQEMHNVFIKYYHNAGLDSFKNDLGNKDGAIIIRRKDNGSIAGFSTVWKMPVLLRGRKVFAFFSGDTIMEREYWGSTVLHFAAIKHVVKEKIKHLSVPLYWFLISKGYKTYLLLANNLNNYYPGMDRETDDRLKELLDECCMKLFPENYYREEGLLKFGRDYQKLRSNIAEITEEMKRKYPKIAFFEKVNPTWRQGTELPCIGEVSMPMILSKIFKFTIKYVRRTISGFLGKNRKSGAVGLIASGRTRILYDFPSLTW
jgi:hypothetical protein